MGNNCCTTSLVVKTVWFPEFEKELPSLQGKRIAITGTTSGTGKIAALTCLQRGAEVFMLNRASERAEETLRELRRACPAGAVQQIPCDLQDFASVREGAKQLLAACQGRLDVLCNNAGISSMHAATTKDCYCAEMQTNHLSHFLLTGSVMPALRSAAEQTGEARIVNHSSVSRIGSKLNVKLLEKNPGPIGGLGLERYHHSKLANVLFTYELADRLAGSNVKAIVVAPGMAATNIQNVFSPSLVRVFGPCLACMLQSAEDGTMPLLAGIAGPDSKSGDLLTPSLGGKGETKGPVKTTKRPCGLPECDDKESQEVLWTLSEKAVSIEFKA